MKIPDEIKYRRYQQLEDHIRRKEASNRAFANATPVSRLKGWVTPMKQLRLAEYGKCSPNALVDTNQIMRLSEQGNSVMRLTPPSNEESNRALLLPRLALEGPPSRARVCERPSYAGKDLNPAPLLLNLSLRQFIWPVLLPVRNA